MISRKMIPAVSLAVVFLLGGVTLLSASDDTDLETRVANIERAFAKTMADRDHEAFQSFLSEEAVFVSGSTRRGKAAVAEQWKRYFEDDEPPFSWQPETVEVLESGKLALSTGPVHNTAGELISYYTSIWRQ